MIENFEDFYTQDRKRIEEFFEQVDGEKEAWDGSVDPEVDEVLKRLGKGKEHLLEKYKTEGDENLSDEECEKILTSAGKRLPTIRKGASSDPSFDFEDVFMGD